MESEPEVVLNPGGRTAVHRRGAVVVREATAHTPAVHALLRHLEAVGFAGAPCLVGSGRDDQGRETLTFLEGEVTHPGPWSLEGVAAVGRLLRGLHEATASFTPSPGAVWFSWHGRDIGDGSRLISHRDAAPWNIVAREGLPVGLIDWEFAGPVDPLTELAQVCWLNAKLHDDVVAEREGLPPLDERARHLRAIVDGYELPAAGRSLLFDRMVEFVVSEIAWEADDAGITSPEVTAHPQALWAMAWRARAASWLLRHRRVLENALS